MHVSVISVSQACAVWTIYCVTTNAIVHYTDNSGRRKLSLRVLRLTILPAWLTNFKAAYGLARSMTAYGGLRRRLGGLHIGDQQVSVLSQRSSASNTATAENSWPEGLTSADVCKEKTRLAGK